MSTFKVRFTLPVDVTVEVEAADEEAAIDRAIAPLREFADGVWSRENRRVFATASIDDLDPYEVVREPDDAGREEIDRG